MTERRKIEVAVTDKTKGESCREVDGRQAVPSDEQARLLDQAHVLIRDMDDRIVLWNKGMEELYGWTKGEAIGQVTHTFFRTEFPESFEEYESKLLGEGSWEGELVHTKRDGSKIVVASHHVLHRAARGQPSAILEVNNDVTERKRAEERLRRSEEDLRLSEERYRCLVAATAMWVWTTNAQGELTGDIPEWRTFTGQTEEEARGSGWLEAVHPDDRHRMQIGWSRAVETGTLHEIEYRVRRHDGEYRNCVVHGVPVLEKDGAIREWVATLTDVTERKRAEEALRESEGTRIRETFMRDMHDHVIQSVFAIGLGLEVCRRGVPKGARDLATHLDGAIEGLNSVIREVRWLLSDSKGRFLDKTALERAFREEIQRAGRDQSIPIEDRIDRDAFGILTEDQASHLLAILREALSNSLRHASARRIVVELSRTKQGARLRVVDDGKGLVEGGGIHAGMGLENIRSRAVAMGATCGIFAPAGGGTCVQIELPEGGRP